ncbi:PREDICTED: putative F-box protein At3g28280 [Camelina sativa]|uniref:F-box protein At3g28280 n=1 Tax=Camelina sativa TaxID=90675 RepID=A0ABM0YWV8_CAMSA|nr:PREDICTED: putative F-box protein At3g28280 [Camelina sativa]
MNPLTEDLWEIILARLPIKVIKSSKLVCKQWKSIVESPYFRDLFLSLHKNSHCSSWSLMFSCSTREIVAHYGCDTWGLPRSLGFYISSFLTNKFKTQNGRYKAWVYTDDVGLILISENYFCAKNRSLYVANPISQECVRIPSHAHLNEYSRPLGMATQTKNGIFLGYKIVVVDFPAKPYSLSIFSSETGLWSHKTNSHCSSWSLMFSCSTREIVAHYGCDTWGLPRSLGFYISSFLTNKFKTQNGRYKAWVYTDDVGLILISENYFCAKNRSLYVANPISQECVRIPSHAHLNEYSRPLGMATQTKNGIFLGYKIVVVDFPAKPYSLSIFSSETGLWSHKTVHEHFPWRYNTAISLHENIHWLAGISDQEEGVVTMDLYATGSIQCRVTPFPDSGKHPRFIRSLSTCQGSLMYMNIVSVSKVDGSLDVISNR